MAQGPPRILLGRIAGAHGIRGEVVIHAYTAAPEDIGAYGALSTADGTRTFQISAARATAKGVVARLKGVVDRTAAEALKGVELYVERARMPAAADGEYYHADLIGLAAVDAEGKALGEIVAVQNFGAGDLIEVRLAGSHRTELVAFNDTNVPAIDLAARQAIVVMPPVSEGDEEE